MLGFEPSDVGSIPAGPAKETKMEIKFKKFEPIGPTAPLKVKEFLERGGHIILETKTFVEVKRLSSIAKIDKYGTVEWRPE